MKATPIRCLLIDDELEARYILKELLREIPEVRMVGEAAAAAPGLEAIQTLLPDLVFLDIQMPGKSGLDLCRKMQDLQLKTKVVFVTAFDSYTVQALRLAALDYLMKPVDPQELKAVFDRFRTQKHQPDQQQEHMARLLDQLLHTNKLRFNTRTGFLLIDPADIMAVRADGNYAEIIRNTGHSVLISQSIGQLEPLLPRGKFFRASRSALINLHYVSRFDRKKRLAFLENNDFSLEMAIARDHVAAFEMCNL